MDAIAQEETRKICGLRMLGDVEPYSHNRRRFAAFWCRETPLSALVPNSSANPATMSGVHLRKFAKADFDILWRIDQSCFDPQLAYSRPELAFYTNRPGSFTIVAEKETSDREIVGFVVAETRRKNGHIITIDVVAKARKEGIGSALLAAAENHLSRAGATNVSLETPVNNEVAIRFYKQQGYFVEKTVAGYYAGHLDALVMVKTLVPLSSANQSGQRKMKS